MFGMNDPFGFNSHINQIMNNFMMDPFSSPLNQMSGRSNNEQQNQLSIRNHSNPFGMQLNPFDRHNSLLASHNNSFSLMNQMMSNMHGNLRNFDLTNMNNSANMIEANGPVFSSSSVISFSNSGDGKPKIYQASSQMRQGPGGVKETRQMVRDSEKGIEKMSVGHHIGNRAHVIERQKVNGGHIEETINLENLDDEEVNEFNKEFEEKLTHARYNNAYAHNHKSHHLRKNQPFAIEDSQSNKKAIRSKERKGKSTH